MNYSHLNIFVLLVLIIYGLSCSDEPTNPVNQLEIPDIPQPLNDGWQVSTLAEQNMNSETIGRLSAFVRNGEFGEVHSMHIVRHGHLVFDEYYKKDHSADKTHFLASVTKSVASVLIGIAIKQGFIEGANQNIIDFFPEYVDIFNEDSQKQDLKLWHLLTMTAGFEWVDGNGSMPESDDYNVHITADNAVEYVLSKQIIYEPGTHFDYSGGCSILLSAIIGKTTGMSAEEFTDTYLFSPLGITEFHFQNVNDGHTDLIGGLSLKPRDLAKIGQLFLDGGYWKEQQIITEDWIIESTRDWIATDEWEHYGFQWWLLPLDGLKGHTLQSNDIFFASGFGGQKLYVINELDMVVVFTGSCTGYEITDNNAQFALYLYIIPSIMDK
jgi:CubicO group peptidase (beta-lactamase class C family)